MDGLHHLPVPDDVAYFGDRAGQADRHLEHRHFFSPEHLVYVLRAHHPERFAVLLNGYPEQLFLQGLEILSRLRHGVEVGLERIVYDTDAPAVVDGAAVEVNMGAAIHHPVGDVVRKESDGFPHGDDEGPFLYKGWAIILMEDVRTRHQPLSATFKDTL